MSYYFKPKTGEFVDSSSDINDPDYISLSDAQYHISRLVVRGYNREQIEIAVDILFNTIEASRLKEQQKPAATG